MSSVICSSTFTLVYHKVLDTKHHINFATSNFVHNPLPEDHHSQPGALQNNWFYGGKLHNRAMSKGCKSVLLERSEDKEFSDHAQEIHEHWMQENC